MTVSRDLAVSPARAKVLLVEDDDELRRLIAETLSLAGCEVVEARDGEDFIDRLTETPGAAGGGPTFDVIVSDIQMPAFSALDVLVGAHRLIEQTPVVLITAFGDEHTHAQALLRGASVVLDKPVKMATIRETVTDLLLEAQARTTSAHAGV